MGTFISANLTVAPGEVRRDTINGANNRASAFIVGRFNGLVGEVRFEPTIINRGEMYLQSGGFAAGSYFQYSESLRWDDATFENYGLISAVLLDMAWVRIITAIDDSPDIINAGRMIAEASDAASIVRLGTSLILHNRPGSVMSVASNQQAFALDLQGGGEIVNEGSITAHVRGGTVSPDTEAAYAIFTTRGLRMVNSGLVEATRAGSYQPAEAIRTSDEVPLDIVNSGTIRGSQAISATPITRASRK